ncbi:hypothetical protein F4861DRAFT_533593 [Xylaria intraflava]|nr:hypothetical protein F4861DRAFT_533593 [Xylaria intraflava]
MIQSMNSPGTHVALVEWANAMIAKFAPNRAATLRVNDAEELFDGALFSALLEIFDPVYKPARFEQSLAESKTSGETSRSMHIIHMGLKDLARRLCSKIEPLIKMVDFQALDRAPTRVGMSEVNPSPRTPILSPNNSSLNAPPSPYRNRGVGQQHTNPYLQVLLIFLCAACFHEDNAQYIIMVQQLDSKYQSSIFTILNEINTRLDRENTTTDSDSGTVAGNAKLDADLAHEAAISNLQREAEEAKRQAGGLRVRLDRLQENNDELVRQHERLQDENELLRKQIESEAGSFDRHRIQQRLKENEAVIANLENERNALIEEKERLLKDKSRLEASAQKAELLVDENQELIAKNEELSKKANMADNLRKKVEASKHLEAELTSLRNDRMDLAKTYDQLTRANSKIETLKRESEAYAAKMQGYEIDIADMRDQKLALVAQNQDLMVRMNELEQRSHLDEAVVKDLQEKILMLDPSAVVDDALATHPASLEDELKDSHNTVTMRNLEVQRLQAENSVLKNTIGSETDKGQLVQEMEDLRASRQALQTRYNDIFEKFTVGQKQIDILIQNMSGNGLVEALQACYDLDPSTKWLMSDFFREEAYSNLRTQVLAEQGRSKQFERQLEIVKEQLADKERAILEARGDCKAIVLDYLVNGEDADTAEKVAMAGKSTVDALTELKSTDGMISASLRAELDVERRKYKLLKDEFDAMQKQLVSALIEKDEIRREAEHANLELQKAADGQTVSTDYIKQSEKIEKLRTRYKQLHQVSHISSNPDDFSSDGDGVVLVEEKHKSMWQSLSPWFTKSPKLPENDFYSYEIGGDGAVAIPKRPVSQMHRQGGSLSPSSVTSALALGSPTSPGGPSNQQDKRPQRRTCTWLTACSKQQYEQSEGKNRELERTLKAVRSGTEASEQKAQAEKVIKNLQRETTLVATAWYDLTSRLQSNHYVVQRRNEAPKSWLNKQRQLVHACDAEIGTFAGIRRNQDALYSLATLAHDLSTSVVLPRLSSRWPDLLQTIPANAGSHVLECRI